MNPVNEDSQPPLVSVIVPNYNHARYLPLRLDSIRAQTFQDYELILMDDCSTDGSRSILEAFARSEPRASLIMNESNSGTPFKQWNKGVKQAKGEIVWLAESDDYAHPRFLERMLSALRDRPQVGVAYCESNVVDENDVVLGDTAHVFDGLGNYRDRWEHDFIANGRTECSTFMIQKNMIVNASAAVFRKSVYLKTGGADEFMRLCGDWKLWATMMRRSDVSHVAEPLNYFRTHVQTARHTTSSWRSLLERAQTMRFLSGEVEIAPEILSYLKICLADSYINAWLWRDSSNKIDQAWALQELLAFDPRFRWRWTGRAIQRGIVAAKKQRGRYWAAQWLRQKQS